MKDETLAKVCALVYNASDEELRAIQDAMNTRFRDRRAQRTADAVSNIKVGDTVVFQQIKPKYLEGTRGIVTSRRGLKFRVRLDPERVDPRAIRRFGLEPLAPASILRKVNV